jgi:hypothetical protein
MTLGRSVLRSAASLAATGCLARAR